MVREANHHGGGAALSSIALLQERFRQLQKMKELRQERELLRMLSESEKYSSPRMKEFLPDHPKPHCKLLSLSLWPDSQNKNADSRRIQGQSDLAKSLFSDALSSVKVESFDQSDDIDTSLRL